MRFAPQGYERISEWKKLIGKIPLIAIGGIKLEHATASSSNTPKTSSLQAQIPSQSSAM